MANDAVIVKRKRVFAAEGHHGGAWKVAYADFVTAMMAFFMLMWILNATTEDQKRGLADFFNPSVPMASTSGGGTDVLWGDSPNTSEMLASTNHGGLTESMASGAELAETLRARLSDEIARQEVRLTLTPEGVIVDLMDTAEKPVFKLGKSEQSSRLAAIVANITPILNESGRPIKIVGHTDDLQFSSGDYTNWELSADRANTARRLLLTSGLADQRIVEVSGQADRLPITSDPSAPQNRRISIILFNERAMPLAQR